MAIVIPKPFILYRSDLDEPPNNWDTAFETAYSTKWPDKGKKNMAGLYFFHDKKEISQSYILEHRQKHAKDKAYYYLTETPITEELIIIDLSCAIHTYNMIDMLMDEGIDILIDSMKNNTTEVGLNHFRKLYYDTKDGRDFLSIFKIKMTDLHPQEDVSYFGQMITDFENGIALKKIFQNAHPEIDGYRWREHNDPRGLTYCLFNPSKLSAPICTEIKF